MNREIEEYSFVLDIKQDIIDDVKNRLRNSRISKDIENDNWRYGTEESYLRELIHYWINNYDWKLHEKEINKFSYSFHL